MILNAYSRPTALSTITNWAVGGLDAGNECTGGQYTIDQVLFKYGAISTRYIPPNADGYGNLSKKDVIYEINGGKPILAVRMFGSGERHALLIRGYLGSPPEDVEKVVFNDPGNGQREEL